MKIRQMYKTVYLTALVSGSTTSPWSIANDNKQIKTMDKSKTIHLKVVVSTETI